MKIKYPAKWVRTKGRKNAYGNYAWGEYNYNRYFNGLRQQIESEQYIIGYRQAEKDIKLLNKHAN
jgi:hypothetical protein